MKNHAFGGIDIFRTITLLILAIFVGVFIAPNAPWVLYLAVGAFILMLTLEIFKYFKFKESVETND